MDHDHRRSERNGTVSYAVSTYVGGSKDRTGTVTIGGKAFTVKQSK